MKVYYGLGGMKYFLSAYSKDADGYVRSVRQSGKDE